MEVKPGYKLTDVGVIPVEWSVRKLPDICWFQEGPGLRNWQFTTSGMKVINVTNLENGVLNLDRTDRHISYEEFNRTYRHFAVDAADIVMASSGNSYGKTAIVRPQDLPLVMNTSVIRFVPAKGCDYGFLWALLNSPRFEQQIDLMITGGAQPNFGPYHLKRINVPFPPPHEQRAIATALSDVDALLGALDRLIAKKRDLKQAAMQQLLSGQTRLPGFTGKWKEKTLAAMGAWKGGMTPSMQNPAYWEGGDFPWISSGDVKVARLKDTSQQVTSVAIRNGAAVVVPANSIVLVTRSGILRKYLPVAIVERPMAINQDIKGQLNNNCSSGVVSLSVPSLEPESGVASQKHGLRLFTRDPRDYLSSAI